MKYLYLLYADESKMPAPGTPAFNAQNDAFNKYFEEINGKGLGFYVIEAKDLDEAVAYAAKCPVASVGAMEVRPIVQM